MVLKDLVGDKVVKRSDLGTVGLSVMSAKQLGKSRSLGSSNR